MVSASAARAIPLLHVLPAPSSPALLVLVAVIGATRGPGDFAKHLMSPDLMSPEAAGPTDRPSGRRFLSDPSFSLDP